MKIYFPTTALALLLFPCGVNLKASENFKLEANAYVFSNADIHTVKTPGVAVSSDTRHLMFRSPAKAQFDQETLSLEASQFSWSSGKNPPDRFSLIGAPDVFFSPGKPVTLLSTVPVQYLEKLANGTLQIREIAGDSPEAPHFRLTFILNAPVAAGEELSLTCNLDIATVHARENVSGVTLEVGKPVLAKFKEKLDLVVRKKEWSALLVQAPNGSSYSLLVLVRIVAGDAPGVVAETGSMNSPMTEVELDSFASTYYRHPRPELVARAISSLGPSGFAKNRSVVFTAFFAKIFADNLSQVAEWQKLINQQDKRTQKILERALLLSRSGDILSTPDPEIELSGRCWGAFLASGDTTYLRKLIDQLRLIDNRFRLLYTTGAQAMVCLALHAHEHPLVRSTLETARSEVDLRTRELIDDLLTKDLSAIKHQVGDAYSDGPVSSSYPPQTGERELRTPAPYENRLGR